MRVATSCCGALTWRSTRPSGRARTASRSTARWPPDPSKAWHQAFGLERNPWAAAPGEQGSARNGATLVLEPDRYAQNGRGLDDDGDGHGAAVATLHAGAIDEAENDTGDAVRESARDT